MKKYSDELVMQGYAMLQSGERLSVVSQKLGFKSAARLTARLTRIGRYKPNVGRSVKLLDQHIALWDYLASIENDESIPQHIRDSLIKGTHYCRKWGKLTSKQRDAAISNSMMSSQSRIATKFVRGL